MIKFWENPISHDISVPPISHMGGGGGGKKKPNYFTNHVRYTLEKFFIAMGKRYLHLVSKKYKKYLEKLC